MLSKDSDNLRTKLILAGLKELEEHGIKDFSLRRVALMAEVSCAAPYRHFKNKDELILGVLQYIKDDWFLLCEQIKLVFNDKLSLIKELCVAGVKFWIANGNFLSVLFLVQSSTDKKQKNLLAQFDQPLISAIETFLLEKNINTTSTLLKITIPSLIYGTIMMITRDSISAQEGIGNLKETIDKLLKWLKQQKRLANASLFLFSTFIIWNILLPI